MKMNFAAAALLLAGQAAHAQDSARVATAPLYNAAAAVVLCSVTNYTGSAVDFTGSAVTADDGGSTLALTSDSCSNASVQSGVACQFAANVPQPVPAGYFCSLSSTLASKALASLRITTQLLDSNGNALSNEAGH